MKLHRFGLPVVALGAAATLLTFTPDSEGFSTLGFQLGISQRDFRIFNNFTDAAANNNTNQHSQFPGYTGATVSIWKACIEWNSELHGNGNGDGHQPGDLGSGGANFDATFQGEASQVGNINQNIHSELSGGSGGVLAFTESPGSDGWRIRYYSTWLWEDGPSPNIGGGMDLQGVATHEYGHALGLGHSTAGAATMGATASGNAVVDRSIHADDKAGVQAVYGVIDAIKPSITAVSVSGSTITVTGSGFTATNNRIWFTDQGGDGSALKVSGLNSNGSLLTATIPASATPGDIMIRNGNNGGISLSNTWPFDPGNQSCPGATNYCTAGSNSVSASGAVISSSGSQIIADNSFVLFADGAPANQNGAFFYGPSQQNNPFGNGTMCVAGQLFNLGIISTDFFGSASYSLDLTNPPSAAGQITGGSSWNFQFWYRDPAGGNAAFNLSDGISVPFCN